jgi:peptide/nickel transport system substrate-binding protein
MAPERLLLNEFSSRVKGVGWQSYVNPEVDDLLARMVMALDDAERQALIAQAARLVRDDPPWLFLYNEDDIYAVAPGASGWEARPNGFVDVTQAKGAPR